MLGIFYLDYCDRPFPKSARQCIIGYTKRGMLAKMKKREVPDGWFYWLSECRTPGYLVEGNKEYVTEWITLHMPNKFGKPLRNI